jgi:hypothetical protein
MVVMIGEDAGDDDYGDDEDAGDGQVPVIMVVIMVLVMATMNDKLMIIMVLLLNS